MTDEQHIWDPMSIHQVVELMSGVTVPWWIAGGWAIDLYLGRQTRTHGDTDILILRKDQLAVQKHLEGKGLLLYKTQQPGLKPWPNGEYIERPVDDIWCRWSTDKPWTVQLMLLCTEGDDWVFKRDPSIRGPLDSLGEVSSTGVPYMRPHIQLFYKAKSRTLDKDQSDFDFAISQMTYEDRNWLLKHLKKCFSEGHEWIDTLSSMIAQP